MVFEIRRLISCAGSVSSLITAPQYLVSVVDFVMVPFRKFDSADFGIETYIVAFIMIQP